MTRAGDDAPLRLEQALQLLPDVDALIPFRAFLVSTSRARSAIDPDLTVGKRLIATAALRDLAPQAIARVTDQLAALYQAAVEALVAEEDGDSARAVQALLQGGGHEEAVGRHWQAHCWYYQALRIAEELHDRAPEIEALLRLGHLEAMRGGLRDAARRYQRAFALAEAESHFISCAIACLGLGDVTVAQGRWQGAEAWYSRGLGLAPPTTELAGRLRVGMADTARIRGDLEAAAEWLVQARTLFERLGDADGMARALDAAGLLEVTSGRFDEALTCYREAIARLHRAERNPRLEMSVRLNLCQLFVEWDRLPDAEDEIRRAEELAVVHNLAHQLARLYLVMGRVRARQRDESGFVFFEKAIELCRGSQPSPRLEADVYVEYGRFRAALDEPEESRAYLERAKEIIATIGAGGGARLEGVSPAWTA